MGAGPALSRGQTGPSRGGRGGCFDVCWGPAWVPVWPAASQLQDHERTALGPWPQAFCWRSECTRLSPAPFGPSVDRMAPTVVSGLSSAGADASAGPERRVPNPRGTGARRSLSCRTPLPSARPGVSAGVGAASSPQFSTGHAAWWVRTSPRARGARERRLLPRTLEPAPRGSAAGPALATSRGPLSPRSSWTPSPPPALRGPGSTAPRPAPAVSPRSRPARSLGSARAPAGVPVSPSASPSACPAAECLAQDPGRGGHCGWQTKAPAPTAHAPPLAPPSWRLF